MAPRPPAPRQPKPPAPQGRPPLAVLREWLRCEEEFQARLNHAREGRKTWTVKEQATRLTLDERARRLTLPDHLDPEGGGEGSDTGKILDKLSRDVKRQVIEIGEGARDAVWLPRAKGAALDRLRAQVEKRKQAPRVVDVLDHLDGLVTRLARWEPPPVPVRKGSAAPALAREAANSTGFDERAFRQAKLPVMAHSETRERLKVKEIPEIRQAIKLLRRVWTELSQETMEELPAPVPGGLGMAVYRGPKTGSRTPPAVRHEVKGALTALKVEKFDQQSLLKAWGLDR